MEIALHKYHSIDGHSAIYFQNENEAIKELIKAIYREISIYLKTDNHIEKIVDQCKEVTENLKSLDYQKALDVYNNYFGHKLVLKLSYDVIGEDISIF